MRKLLALLFLLAPLCAHAQFAKIQGGPLVGNCNPHTLGMDFVNNNIYECDGEPVPQWKLVGGINNQGIIPVLLRTNSPNCTTTNQLVQYDPGQVDSAGIGEVTNAAISSTGVIGVVISGAGCSGIATIATYLSAQCITDNQSTVGDLVSPSTTVPGQCHDYGSSLATVVQTVGRVSKANTGQGTASQVDFFLGNQLASGSSGVGTVSNCGTPGGIAYYVTAGSVVGCDPNFTTDGSGNWTSHSGTVNDTSHAGYINYIQGATPPTAPTNGVQLSVPTSVTGYTFYLPGTKPTSGDCAQWSALSGQIQVVDSGSPCGGTGGTVSSFSSGNLSPLFTTSVANATTTPALSFTLSNAGGNTVYGNFTGSNAAPSFNSVSACGDSTHALAWTSGTGFVCQSVSSIHGLSFTIYNSSGLTSGTNTASTDYLTIPFGCTIQAYNLAVDTGTITVKFWKVATGTAIPTVSNSINTSGVSISSGTAIHSTTLSDFTSTTVSANDIMAMNITAVSGATFVNGVLQCQ